MVMADGFAEDVIQELLKGLREGKSMRAICRDKRMPDRETVSRWAKGDGELAASIVRARECGYYARAEKAVEDAKNAKDAALGRLAFDAERWELSKLCRAFADKVVHAGDPDEPIRHQIETKDLTEEQLRALASIPLHGG
jgi:hypothetical protein